MILTGVASSGGGGGASSLEQAVRDAQQAYEKAIKRLKDMPPPTAATDSDADTKVRELASNAVQMAAERLAAAQAALSQAKAAAADRADRRAAGERQPQPADGGVFDGSPGRLDAYV